jgi:hypothetical protein
LRLTPARRRPRSRSPLASARPNRVYPTTPPATVLLAPASLPRRGERLAVTLLHPRRSGSVDAVRCRQRNSRSRPSPAENSTEAASSCGTTRRPSTWLVALNVPQRTDRRWLTGFASGPNGGLPQPPGAMTSYSGFWRVALAAPTSPSEPKPRAVAADRAAGSRAPLPNRAGVPGSGLADRRVSASISTISWTDPIRRSCKRLTRTWPPLLSRERSCRRGVRTQPLRRWSRRQVVAQVTARLDKPR